MSDQVTVAEPAAPVPGAARTPEARIPEPENPAPAEIVTTADVLVEEVSIDGMCGVY